MTDDSNRLRELLDGKLSPEEIAEDPVLSSLAERIYGSDFLEQVGISRGETKRSLAEKFSEVEGDDLLVEISPDDSLPLPMPDDMPDVPSYDLSDDDVISRPLVSKLTIIGGFTGLTLVIVNLFYGFGNFLGGCATSLHDTCGVSMKLNWLDFHRMGAYDAWGPTGSIGIPDIVLSVICALTIILGFRRS